jgi:hypothetical protein
VGQRITGAIPCQESTAEADDMPSNPRLNREGPVLSAQIHYDADIFQISQIIRLLRRGCSVDIDPEFYLDKIIEDILFADDILKTLYSRLNTNDLLVNREQYLRDLYLAKRDLVLLLEDVIGETLPFSGNMKQYSSRFSQIIRSQKEDMMAIDDTLNKDQRQEEEKNIVSQQEFSILMENEETEE